MERCLAELLDQQPSVTPWLATELAQRDPPLWLSVSDALGMKGANAAYVKDLQRLVRSSHRSPVDQAEQFLRLDSTRSSPVQHFIDALGACRSPSVAAELTKLLNLYSSTSPTSSSSESAYAQHFSASFSGHWIAVNKSASLADSFVDGDLDATALATRLPLHRERLGARNLLVLRVPEAKIGKLQSNDATADLSENVPSAEDAIASKLKARNQAAGKPDDAAASSGPKPRKKYGTLPFLEIFLAYVQYATLLFFAYLQEWTSKLVGFVTGRMQWSTPPKGYAPLLKDFDYLYTRYLYGPNRDCWDRTIRSAPSAWVDVAERYGVNDNERFVYTGRVHHALNLGSYNYLGFSETESKSNDDVLAALQKYGTSTTSSQSDAGKTVLHRMVEERTARYVGKEAAICFPMGYATNSTVLPNLIGKGGLIISDANNHASAIMGCRASGAKITIFKHNDPVHLERVLRKVISEGQPRTHRPWTKILIVVEGIYSMEGEVLALKDIVDLKKKYKAYLYVDEAHSIGAIGPRGRGICDYAGVNPADVDILMGTYTKSFASVGGYIASSREMIDHLRNTAFSALYDVSTSVPCCQQILSALDVIEGVDGTDDGQRRIKTIRDNSIYFRKRLVEMGFIVLGNFDSPVVPVLLGSPSKMPVFSRECLRRNLAVVIVGFPATPLIESRVRFCMSAGHTRADLDSALEIIQELGDMTLIRYKRGSIKPSS